MLWKENVYVDLLNAEKMRPPHPGFTTNMLQNKELMSL